MELSAELFENTIRCIKGDAGSQEKRAHPRVGLRYRMKVIPIVDNTSGKALEVWTRDISRTGISVVCTQRMKSGSRFVIRFPRSDGEPPLTLLCTVKNCTEMGQGIYAVGAAFEGLGKAEVSPAAA